MTAADQPTTEPNEARNAIAKVLDSHHWSGTVGRSHDDPGGIRWSCTCGHESSIDGMSGHSSWLAEHAVHAAEELLAVLTPAPQPAADTEPVQRATELLVQHQATSVSGCICGGVSLGRSHPEHAARVLDDVGLLAPTRDSRIDAWHRVAEHPVFASSYHEGVPLIESVLRRLDEVAGLDTPAPAGG